MMSEIQWIYKRRPYTEMYEYEAYVDSKGASYGFRTDTFKARHDLEGTTFEVFRVHGVNAWLRVTDYDYVSLIHAFDERIEILKERDAEEARQKELNRKYIAALKKRGFVIRGEKVIIDNIPVTLDSFRKLKRDGLLSEKYSNLLPDKKIIIKNRELRKKLLVNPEVEKPKKPEKKFRKLNFGDEENE